jgi:hypothetical protein
MISTYSTSGNEMVGLRVSKIGGFVSVSNKTGERIVTLSPDEYGNGVVGAWNRNGKGSTLQPGPQ